MKTQKKRKKSQKIVEEKGEEYYQGYRFRLLNKLIKSKYRILYLTLFLFILMILIETFITGPYRKNMLKNSTKVKGHIEWKGRKGKFNKVQIEFYFKGKTRRKYVYDEFSNINIGDCCEIKVANEDPSIIEVNYEKGSIDCN